MITWLEHHANIVPWQQLCSEKGARLRVAPVNDRGEVILEEYEKLLSPRTRIVSFSQVSNALGTITPAREMVEMAHRHGAVSYTHLDVYKRQVQPQPLRLRCLLPCLPTTGAKVGLGPLRRRFRQPLRCIPFPASRPCPCHRRLLLRVRRNWPQFPRRPRREILLLEAELTHGPRTPTLRG